MALPSFPPALWVPKQAGPPGVFLQPGFTIRPTLLGDEDSPRTRAECQGADEVKLKYVAAGTAGLLGSSLQTTGLSAPLCCVPAPRSRLRGWKGLLRGTRRGTDHTDPGPGVPVPGGERAHHHGPQPCGPTQNARNWDFVSQPRFGVRSLRAAPAQRRCARQGAAPPAESGVGARSAGAEGCAGRGRSGPVSPSPRGAAPAHRPAHTRPAGNPQRRLSPARRLMNGRGGSPAPPDVTPANGGAGRAAG